ncbi:hypothetical protein IFM89_016462 [Coptis chinensis]|uniref:Uncharacterized protein n=1 Tax=Coptis chinensis TaxID=261450 RepID=A0A835I5C2_9MAGN|nr:hypothetical protein IFM89_016462 [Coptis chinensis]
MLCRSVEHLLMYMVLVELVIVTLNHKIYWLILTPISLRYVISEVQGSWENAHHRRSVAASLVQGVYVLERDRQENRQGPHALAS